MRAVQLTAYGDPLESLKYVDIPAPVAPGPNQVLIAVEFSPLNQSDLLLARGIYGTRPLFQPSSAMKVSAACSLWGREWKVLRSATAYWPRFPASPGESE
jgi:NADPH:quinone reductase and related Zn-dependent oxidoreductases